MKLAFVYPEMLVGGRPLDFDQIDTSPRGTTGSEIQILSMAQETAKRGHEVWLFIAQPQVWRTWGAVHVRPLPPNDMDAALFDATLVSLDCNFFLAPPWLTSKKRVVFQQVNDFNYAQPGALEKVDLFVSPSEPHREHMEEVSPETKGRWAVIPNGCYPSDFKGGAEGTSSWGVGAIHEYSKVKTPGRVVYASSPDRGPHLLLQEWPRIHAAVPHATLKIFYYALQRWIDDWARFPQPDPSWIPFWTENWRRARYVDQALKAFAAHGGMGVEVVGAVSRRQLASEFDAAEVLAYPCDTIAYTEGFSCATLEGCASGALPVIAGTDALGRIYRGSTPMVPGPARKHIAQWRELVVKALTDQEWADDWRRRGRAMAEAHAWPVLAEKLEKILEAKA